VIVERVETFAGELHQRCALAWRTKLATRPQSNIAATKTGRPSSAGNLVAGLE
jgi:hypothetical protein